KMGIGRRILSPDTVKAVFQLQVEMRVGRFVKQVAVTCVELIVTVVSHLDETVFNPKGIGMIIAILMVMDLGRPALQVFAVKNRSLFGGAAGTHHQNKNHYTG